MVGHLLGAGAFGSVYAALRAEPEPGLPGRAALKVLPTGTRTPASYGTCANSPSARPKYCAGCAHPG